MSSRGLPNLQEWRVRKRDLGGMLADRALDNLIREYPHAAIGIEIAEESFARPRDRHPVFFGAYDWHSAVHNYWLLLRWLSAGLDRPVEESVVRLLGSRLTPENLAREEAFLDRPGNRGFERPYGLVWLLALVAEIRAAPVAEASVWADRLAGLESMALGRLTEYFQALTWPVRAGVHANSAFALRMSLQAARASGLKEFAGTAILESRRLFRSDQDYNSAFEPSGEDFLSPGLSEISLMAEVLVPAEFQAWFRNFLPDRYGDNLSWLHPVRDFYQSDGRMVHLAGLNLSRAWNLFQLVRTGLLGEALDVKWARRGEEHLLAGLEQLEAGGFSGRHWLPTFATLALEACLELAPEVP